MAKKRKTNSTNTLQARHERSQFGPEEQFNDSEDEFYAVRDKISLDDGPTAKRRRRTAEQERDLQPSDEEVLPHHESEDDDFDDARSEVSTAPDSGVEDDNIWGATKADYYNVDVIETEADALEEEAEARRLQQKQLRSMNNTDFGFDDLEWTQSISTKGSRPVVEKLPEVKIPASASRRDKLDILQKRYPEFELLAKDLNLLRGVQKDLETHAEGAGIITQTKLRAVTAYLASITMYFAIISSSRESSDPTQITSLSPNVLRDHAIIDTLITTRQSWDSIKNAEEHALTKSTFGPILGDVKVDRVKVSKDTSEPVLARPKRRAVVRSAEVEEPIAFHSNPSVQPSRKPKKQNSLRDLVTQIKVPESLAESDIGDEAPLTAEEAAEKARRKKDLRFYTSQIAQKANKREAASRHAGGDDDVPHKERLRDKQERLLKEAERRAHQQPTAREQLDDIDDDDYNNLDVSRGDGYYESLVAQSKEKKAAKKLRAEAYSEAAKRGAQVYEEDQVGADGKRKITYAIEKNKGLMPKRKKDVRNPRVKKRKKFDEKVKKLGSVRQVYKGGEGKGGYGGEMTGIKTNVVKSVKLS